MADARIIVGDCRAGLATLDAGSVHTCITSPPYWGLRDYGHDGQMGLEQTPDEYVAGMVEVFRAVARVLRTDGTLWLNLGDSYAGGGGGNYGAGLSVQVHKAHPGSGSNKPRTPHGLKPKDLCGIPWRVAFALQADGWYLRSDIIWAKPNPMPESVTDRPTKGHEYLFLLAHPESKGRYFYDADAAREAATEPHGFNGSRGRQTHKTGAGGDRNDAGRGATPGTGYRNKRTVWTIPTQPFPGAHFAVMPPALVIPCVKAGSPVGGLVLDPFAGAGTVGVVAAGHGRRFVGCELSPEYAALAEARIANPAANLRAPVADPRQGVLFG